MKKFSEYSPRVYNTRAQLMEILKRSPDATPVTDVLTYYVDMACWFMEGIRPVEVVARSKYKIFKELGYNAADVTWAIITFENGAVVNLGISYAPAGDLSDHRPKLPVRNHRR